MYVRGTCQDHPKSIKHGALYFINIVKITQLLVSVAGKLSHWLQMAVGNTADDVDYLLIDRANNRYKVHVQKLGVLTICQNSWQTKLAS